VALQLMDIPVDHWHVTVLGMDLRLLVVRLQEELQSLVQLLHLAAAVVVESKVAVQMIQMHQQMFVVVVVVLVVKTVAQD
jgi:hypothetical protein